MKPSPAQATQGKQLQQSEIFGGSFVKVSCGTPHCIHDIPASLSNALKLRDPVSQCDVFSLKPIDLPLQVKFWIHEVYS